MNFTREPIIETVISPREGCKIVVRNSKGNGQEDYHVDAVEVVSFGHSLFFRSLEKPKPFLVPVSDYEILELRETKMVLKNAPAERSIKIGGGKEAPPRSPREPVHEAPQEEPAEMQGSSDEAALPGERPDRKRDRRRRGRRGGRERSPQEVKPASSEEASPEGFEPGEMPALSEEPVKAPSFISKLFPPPPMLIKETLSRYKSAIEPSAEEKIPSQEKPAESVEEPLFERQIPEEESSDDDGEI